MNTSNSSSSMAFLSVSRALELAPLLGRNFFSTFSPNRPTRKSSSVSYALVGFSRCCLTVLLTNLWSLDAISPRSRIKPRDTLFHIPVNLYTLLSYSTCGIFSNNLLLLCILKGSAFYLHSYHCFLRWTADSYPASSSGPAQIGSSFYMPLWSVSFQLLTDPLVSVKIGQGHLNLKHIRLKYSPQIHLLY